MSTKAKQIQTVLFDLDGTLVDNFQALYLSYVYAHETLGLEPPSFELVKRSVGGSAPVTMERIIGKERAAEALDHFYKRFNEVMFEGLELMPGALNLIQALKAKGKDLAVFTNKTGDISRAICKELKIDQYMDLVIGAGDTAWRKPDVEFSKHVLDSLKADVKSTVLIGDSPFDKKAADVVNIDAYLVCTGTHSKEELGEEFDEAILFDSLEDIGKAVFEL